MENQIITSKGSSLFSQGQLLLIFLASGIAVTFSPFSDFKGLTLLVWVFVFIKKDLKIDVEAKKFKDGQLKKWKVLSPSGYISLVRKVNMSTKKVDNESLKLLWVEGKNSTHMYSPTDMEDGEATAMRLAEVWKCGVYLPHQKTWLRAQE